jgi:glycerate-2-kinase
MGGRSGLSIDAARNPGRSNAGGVGASEATNVVVAAGKAAITMQASAQSAMDFAGQQGHLCVPPW